MPLLWKDFKELEDCSGCPLKKDEICPGGTTCYGGAPIEPPCYCFDDDTDLEQWVSDYWDYQLRCDEAESKRIQAQAEKDRKNAIARQRRSEAKLAVLAESREIKSLQKRIRANEAAFHLAESFAFAFNSTNEMFGYSERMTQRENALQEQNRPLLARIAELETIKREKLKQLRQSRKGKE